MPSIGRIRFTNHLGDSIEFSDETGVLLGDSELFSYERKYSYKSAPATIELWGAAEDATISIGGFTYQVYHEIPEGGKLVIDGFKKTAKVIDADGNETNVLDDRQGLQVKGSGYYLFEEVPRGHNEVTWNPHNKLRINIHEFKSLDLAFGSSENNFMLVVPDYQRVTTGEYFYLAESEWGGIIDRIEIGYSTGKPKLTYSGRSWHGILSHKVICPDAGSDYLTYSGDINRIIDMLIQRQALQERFVAEFTNCGFEVSGRFDRYTDMYTALLKICKAAGCKLKIRTTVENKVELSAVEAKPIYLDSDQYELHQR